MKNTEGIAWILEESEFGILLGAKGIFEFQGLPLRNLPETEEEILKKLWNMEKKGFLTSDGMNFTVEKGLAQCLHLLEKSKGLLVITPEREEMPQSFCYPAEELLVCQEVLFRKDTLKLQKMSWKQLEDLLPQEGGYIRFQYYEKNSDKIQIEFSVRRGWECYRAKDTGEEYTWEELEYMFRAWMEDRENDFG
ncbi:MAG: hypothetical protein ACLUJN_06180 [Blautia sp.]